MKIVDSVKRKYERPDSAKTPLLKLIVLPLLNVAAIGNENTDNPNNSCNNPSNHIFIFFMLMVPTPLFTRGIGNLCLFLINRGKQYCQ